MKTTLNFTLTGGYSGTLSYAGSGIWNSSPFSFTYGSSTCCGAGGSQSVYIGLCDGALTSGIGVDHLYYQGSPCPCAPCPSAAANAFRVTGTFVEAPSFLLSTPITADLFDPPTGGPCPGSVTLMVTE